MRVFYLLGLIFFSACSKNVYQPIVSNLPAEYVTAECKQVNEVLVGNLFFCPRTKKYLISCDMKGIFADYCKPCLEQLTLKQIKSLLGTPTCEGEGFLCYQIHFTIPKGKSLSDFHLDTDKVGFRFKENKEGKVKIENYINCKCGQ